MFLDSDAALTPDALPAMVSALDENRQWGLLGPRLVYDDGSLQMSCRRFPPLRAAAVRVARRSIGSSSAGAPCATT